MEMEQDKKNRQEILEKRKEKITCECGAIITKGAIYRHKKSMKHIKLTTCIIID